MISVVDILQGVVVETRTTSLTGPLFYSDRKHEYYEYNTFSYPQSFLNSLSTIPVIGMLAGITRMVLAVIHTVGHLFAALITINKGHCYHALKGGCEFLRGFIEAIPLLGRKFAQDYCRSGQWWIIKIYNPDAPDSLDEYANFWNNLKQNRPSGYVVA